jgi:hypothetical protein
MKTKAVIDRIEDGRHAVLITRDPEAQYVFPVERMPPGVTDGSWLEVEIEDGKLISAVFDVAETEAARERTHSKLDKLRKRGRRLQ